MGTGQVSLEPREGGMSLEDMLAAEAKSKTLIVAFSGGATNKIGITRLEFRRLLSEAGTPTMQCDQLYVLDPTGMSFYEHGIADFTKQLRRAILPYTRVVMIGNCMGATAALRFSVLLTSPKSVVLAFNPEVSPSVDPRISFRIAAKLMPRKMHALPRVVQEAVECTPARALGNQSSSRPNSYPCPTALVSKSSWRAVVRQMERITATLFAKAKALAWSDLSSKPAASMVCLRTCSVPRECCARS